MNASDLIIKTCLNQKYYKWWHFVIYFSKKLSSTKENYDVHNKKLLAITVVLKKWRMYVKKKSKIIKFMNHKNLLYFIKIKKLNQWQIKWLKILEQYKFIIQYILTKNNDRANALNKRCDHMKNKIEFSHNIFEINKNGLLSVNTRKLSTIIKILWDNKKIYFIINNKFQISKNKITEIIKKYHDDLFQRPATRARCTRCWLWIFCLSEESRAIHFFCW